MNDNSNTLYTIRFHDCAFSSIEFSLDNVLSELQKAIDARAKYAKAFVESSPNSEKQRASAYGIRYCNSLILQILSIPQ